MWRYVDREIMALGHGPIIVRLRSIPNWDIHPIIVLAGLTLSLLKGPDHDRFDFISGN
jgi:hypothetical protein